MMEQKTLPALSTAGDIEGVFTGIRQEATVLTIKNCRVPCLLVIDLKHRACVD